MAEFKKLPTQEELQRMLYMGQLQGKTNQEIIQDNLATGSTIKALPDNLFQKMATGAGIAKEQVNRLWTAADVAKLFPGYTGEKQFNIPTGYNFAPKQDVYGGVTPQGLQTQPINVNQLLQAIKPADVLGITGAQQAYTDVGMGKAPNPMDVLDVAGLGAAGIGAGKGLLGVAKATKGLPVGMSIKDVSKTANPVKGLIDTPEDFSYRSMHEAPGPDFGAPLHDLTGSGQMYPADVYSPKAVQYYGTGFDEADRKAFAIANSVKGNPDATVTMYRAVPKELSNSEKLAKIEKEMSAYMKRKTLPKDANTNDGSKWYDSAYEERERLRQLPDEPVKGIDTINAGDWVTLTKDYAKQHGESVLNGKYKIISKKVKAKDLWTNADSIQEFGYNPSK